MLVSRAKTGGKSEERGSIFGSIACVAKPLVSSMVSLASFFDVPPEGKTGESESAVKGTGTRQWVNGAGANSTQALRVHFEDGEKVMEHPTNSCNRYSKDIGNKGSAMCRWLGVNLYQGTRDLGARLQSVRS
ncbi:hypothetical protein HBI56_023720 [Parastagonospora nodorum]|uniref:Uncharacterized protein n=1 Tax=Phaeosphaeria nodorum (strain SN15 / ATCC MYA-4574 / FGSC 10173) TaxID=321614 RepID=A0A7U2F503_PHANO|nr:hypothetical protein HBH56_024790 [Parastagonospora nodorum]QRC98828.1 hypothetical protein JI435_412640 [Parastagonospora nodorum SN15]KAH3934334.1 hypothetical protein HBH54_057210 [Parastagonospora nodorum]KAH3949820.1 hypothetical protein HBH53_084900 [Parastagonospora nodorum]KAH3976043.1 hypothetical protein HBH51_080450 [Parastagonospora nodorum]